MKVYEGKIEEFEAAKPTIVTIGNFDGVHRGHQEIISRLKMHCEKAPAFSTVMTFFPHPQKILAPNKPFYRLFDTNDQNSCFEKLGIDQVIRIKFTKELSQLSPEDFVNQVIIKPLNPIAVYVGYDFAFGRGRSGTLRVLHDLLSAHKVEVHVIEPITYEGRVVSSSLIKQLLKEGQVELAKKYLKRPFYLAGEVSKGDQIGRHMGFRTCNINLDKDFVTLNNGVYITRVEYKGRKFRSISNLGTRPTVTESDNLILETHLLDEELDLYNEQIKVEFFDRIRSEKKFDSREELSFQIEKDISLAKSYRFENDELE